MYNSRSFIKPATTLVVDSFSGNSLVYLIVLFRQKFPLVSVIVVVGLAHLSCCCDHCVTVANKPDQKNVRQRTFPLRISQMDISSVSTSNIRDDMMNQAKASFGSFFV